MSSDEQSKGSPPRNIGQILLLVLPIALGMLVGRLAGDAVKESVGYWGSLGVGLLAACGTAVVVALLLIGWQRRRS